MTTENSGMTTPDASSDHFLNADRGLSRVDKLRWLFLNWRNNANSTAELDPSLELLRFRTDALMSQWSQIDAVASPARRLSDLFWLSVPWVKLARQLGGTVNVIEVGCGTGRYGVLLQKCLGSAFGRYVGVDMTYHSQWEEHRSNPAIKLVVADSGQTRQFIAEANLVITQSAIEHFDEDVLFFRQLAEHVKHAGRPVVQIHLMPSAGCLSTFLWHGVRHYTPRTASRITRLFGDETRKRLYFLGSAHCNRLHRRYITYPVLFGKGDWRYTRTEEYNRALREAMQKDERAPKPDEACFHALVLQTGMSEDIFA